MPEGIPEEKPWQPNVTGYQAYIADINTREISAAETYDKALLTLSSVFLGLSLTFIKDLVAIATARGRPLLFIAWSCFALTIITTIGSFIVQRFITKKLKEHARPFFLEPRSQKEKDDLNKQSETRQLYIDLLNTFAGVLFILAVLGLTAFVSFNISQGGAVMSDSETKKIQEAVPTPTYTERKAAPVPTFQEFAPPTSAPPDTTPTQPASQPAATQRPQDQPQK